VVVPAVASPLQQQAAAEVSAPTLRDSDRHLIVRTVQACEGNVSKAARALGVSRGLVYRHLKQAQQAQVE
jgi:transcriptional regulator of acetoin/glycerol metabolism